jgi:hypothetical protein
MGPEVVADPLGAPAMGKSSSSSRSVRRGGIAAITGGPLQVKVKVLDTPKLGARTSYCRLAPPSLTALTLHETLRYIVTSTDRLQSSRPNPAADTHIIMYFVACHAH